MGLSPGGHLQFPQHVWRAENLDSGDATTQHPEADHIHSNCSGASLLESSFEVDINSSEFLQPRQQNGHTSTAMGAESVP